MMTNIFKSICAQRSHCAEEQKEKPDDQKEKTDSTGRLVKMTPFVQFCKTTSIKGVPRIFTSDEHYVKILWALAVTCFLGLALSQTSSLVKNYFQFNTVLRSKRYYYSESNALEKHWFPSMTICDLQYSWTDRHQKLVKHIADLGLPPSGELNQDYERAWREHFNNSEFFDEEDMYPTHFVNMETLGQEALFLKSLNLDQFVPYCKLLVSGLFKRQLDCRQYVNISLLPVFDYQTCIRVDLNLDKTKNLLEARGYSVYGISLLLYASRMTGDNKASGGVIYHHTPLSQPNVFLDRSSLNVSPGRQYTIHHEEILMTRKNTTERTCALPETQYKDVSGRMVNYSTTSCIDHCITEIFYDTCGCLFRGQIRPLSVPEGTKYCGDLWDGKEIRLTDEFLCMVNNTKVLGMCNGKCNHPCEERAFSVQISSSDWPSEGTVWNFFRDVKTTVPNFLPQFQLHTYEALSRTNKTAAAIETANLKKVLKEHYYVVDSMTKGNTYIVYEEVYEMAWDNLIGQVGGILNLYAGITLVIIIELLEIFIRYCVQQKDMFTVIQ